ncbi:MAG: response regulator [Treponema sp.]|nr:response regulator [Treponema sp.]
MAEKRTMYVMKSVLLIDGSSLFSGFLKDTFAVEKISFESVFNREAYTKIITLLPDLIIIEIENEISDDIMHLLEKKHTDPNARKIPIVIVGPDMERPRITNLLEFGVVKYFTKPVKFEPFLAAVGKIMKTSFSLDTTPSFLDIHLNANLIFIEIAFGLNREKIRLLKYRIAEVIKTHGLNVPKVILMLSGYEFSFVDGVSLEFLIESISADGRIANKNIQILSSDEFVHELVRGHTDYIGMQVFDNLKSIAELLLEQDQNYKIEDFVLNRIISSDGRDNEIALGFSDSRNVASENGGSMIKVAVIDSDAVVRKLLQGTFAAVSGEADLFETAASFLDAVQAGKIYDVVILDLYLPDMDGISVIKTLARRNFQAPILIYSRAASKEVVVQALSLGVRSYLVKPQKPGVVLNKAVEILHASNL